MHQRDYDQMFSSINYKTLTGHLSYYYHPPATNILFTIKGGRYLAKDSGFTFDFSRIFRSGLRMGAYFSLTDISAFEFGEGSFDKGFYFLLPLELFSNKHSKETVPWGLRPLTRDGAAFLDIGYDLYGVTEQAQYNAMNRDFNDIYN